ncbi:MAG: c-type cytochrome [Nitrospinae bacterium]|jgi:cytochrome c peroxidase|nr:c-type cytochrome [Nitrospinota bacterium]MDA1109733.1 c-type cytochrome [Nitrospinota bacterium]
MKFFIPALLFGCLIITSSVQADSTLPEKLGCTSCHRFSSDEPTESHKAPDLFYAGNKFQKNWLEKFLQNPMVIRKAGTINDPGFLKGAPTLAQPHPALSRKEAAKMTEFLISLSLPDLATEQMDDTPLTKSERVRTKILFERNYGCIACHEGINLAGQARGGISGPSLANAGNRLKANWVFNKLKTPEKILPKSRMPLYKFDDATAIKLTKYMMTLKIGDWK